MVLILFRAVSGMERVGQGTCEFVFFHTAAKGVGSCFETTVFSGDWFEPDAEVFGE